MSEIKTIDGFLTLKRDGKTVLDKLPSILTIDAQSERGYVHAWHLDSIIFPENGLTHRELDAIYDAGMESQEGRFNVEFNEDNTENDYTGQAFIAAIVDGQSKIDLRGATELKQS